MSPALGSLVALCHVEEFAEDHQPSQQHDREAMFRESHVVCQTVLVCSKTLVSEGSSENAVDTSSLWNALKDIA